MEAPVQHLEPIFEIAQEVSTAGGRVNTLCFQCGKCDVVCPWNRVSRFSMRRLIRQSIFGLSEIESEELWRCSTCGNCTRECPRGVTQIDIARALRRLATAYGVFAGGARPLRTVRGSLQAEGNPLGFARAQRAAWAAGLEVPEFSEECEYLLFVGCYYAYDPRLKKVAAAAVRVLGRAGVSFGILGQEESCCGESIRKCGSEDLFRALARQNIKTFIDRGVRKMVVLSPHCYHAFKHDYREFMVNFEVVHLSELLASLAQAGRLEMKGAFPARVTFHDPCYLGRHNGLFEPPRELLRLVPGLELVEMAENRASSLCCGGGGGRIWMDTPRRERFSDLRLAQAMETGAQVLISCCPYCISNFEDSRINSGGEGRIEVRDLVEIIDQVTGN